VRTDDSEMMGYLVADRPSEIVMRDVTGHEVAIPKENIRTREKIPGSLMPPNLTASLEKQEFIDLISFLSKLGKSGNFRVPAERFVRRWQTVSANDNVKEKISKGGIETIAKDESLSGPPHYSTASGALPIDELPIIEADGANRYSFVKFQIEVLTPGEVT